MHFVKFHPEVASCLLCRGKRKYAPLGMRLIWKYIRNSFLVYQLLSHFLSYLQNYKEFKAKILDLQPQKYGLSLYIKKCTSSGWALGDENVIGIRAFNCHVEKCMCPACLFHAKRVLIVRRVCGIHKHAIIARIINALEKTKFTDLKKATYGLKNYLWLEDDYLRLWGNFCRIVILFLTTWCTFNQSMNKNIWMVYPINATC